jgi:hypothetical protein
VTRGTPFGYPPFLIRDSVGMKFFSRGGEKNTPLDPRRDLFSPTWHSQGIRWLVPFYLRLISDRQTEKSFGSFVSL